MSAPPETLHVLAHRAGEERRDETDWWGSPIETGLAAAAAVRHHSAYREVGERALDRLLGWWSTEPRRRVSAEVVAVSLAAKTAHALARLDDALTADAAARVADMARRDPAVVPELHVALAVWALDNIVPDRDQAPWPNIRDRLSRGSAHGSDETLRAYSSAVAARTFDAADLVRRMLNTLPASPAPTDAAVVAWLLTAAVERCARTLRLDEPGLLSLFDHRARLVDRLAVDVSERTFLQPQVADLEPDHDERPPPAMHLSSMEALLLDCALASRDAATPWLTFDEARELFGGRERTAEQKANRWRLASSAMSAVAGLFATLTLALILNRYGASTTVTRASATAAAATWSAASIAVARPAVRRHKLLDAVGVLLVTLALVGVVLLVNALLPEPFMEEVTGFAIGGLLGVASSVGWLLLARD